MSEEDRAWKKYYRILDEYHIKYNVKNYNRISIHAAFPELDKAFKQILSAKTFDRLTKESP